jgi:hypothetical protein
LRQVRIPFHFACSPEGYVPAKAFARTAIQAVATQQARFDRSRNRCPVSPQVSRSRPC